jgi:hypothetical protein
VQVIRDAAAAGARSATIVTSGLSELEDAESKQLAVELKEAARETGLAAPGRWWNRQSDVRSPDRRTSPRIFATKRL